MQKYLTIPSLTPQQEHRFWSKVDRADTQGCWPWVATVDAKMYGKFSIDGVRYMAHRVAYTIAHGPITDGQVVDHLCRNPSCVNPSHLEPVSSFTNVWERGHGTLQRSYQRKICRHGHALSQTNIHIDVKYQQARCKRCMMERDNKGEVTDHAVAEASRRQMVKVFSSEEVPANIWLTFLSNPKAFLREV